MAVRTVFILTMVLVSVAALPAQKYQGYPSAFGEHESVTSDVQQPSKRNFNDWLNGFLSKESDRKKITDALDQQTGDSAKVKKDDQSDETTDDSVEETTVAWPKKKKNGHSSGKLSLLKSVLSSASSSSSSNNKSSNLDRLFQILNHTPSDEKNESTSSSSKLDRLLGLFGNRESSNNLQLAMKLMKLSQGNGDLRSFSFSDMKSLLNFVSG